jgi:hypothetical protein
MLQMLLLLPAFHFLTLLFPPPIEL